MSDEKREHSGRLDVYVHAGESLVKFFGDIMSAISDFATKQNAFNDQIDKSVSDIATEIKTLNDTITQLQGTSGAITPEDQALLDAIQTRTQAIATKVAALDTLTPPTPPVS